MKSTKMSGEIQRALNDIQKQYPIVREVAHEIDAYGGRALLVGGAVRDILLGLPVKDLDIEVHGLPIDALEALLKRFGQVNIVGKSFGVLRQGRLPIDWSIPRKDSSGRKPEVALDPNMAVADAFARRDLTINAMGIDIKTGALLDPFGGLSDLENKILRAPDKKLFVEDPLRLFRVMQFISRFEMQPDTVLDELCKKIDISAVSKERIEAEFEKMLLQSKRPSLGIRWLQKIVRLKEILPELEATVHTEQGKKWHPEGDVFEHSMQALDAAAKIPCENQQTRKILLYAALCHDLGKTTMSVTHEDGSISSAGHAQEGARFTKQMLRRIMNNKTIIDAVCALVNYHMVPIQFVDNGAKPPAYKRLARKLAATGCSLSLLADLSLADRRGRNPESHDPLTIIPEELTEFRKNAQKAQVMTSYEEPVLHGRDIQDMVEPGPQMGQLLKKAYDIQIDEGIRDKEELKKRLF